MIPITIVINLMYINHKHNLHPIIHNTDLNITKSRSIHYIHEIRNTSICISGIRFIITYNFIQCFNIAHREYDHIHVLTQVLNGVNPCTILCLHFICPGKKEKDTCQREIVTFS